MRAYNPLLKLFRVTFFMTWTLLIAHGVANATWLADTDGDGTIDQVTICQTNKVCVFHPSNGVTTTYSEPSWSSIAVNSVVDTDGNPGAEIILAATSNGRFHCICVIH